MTFFKRRRNQLLTKNVSTKIRNFNTEVLLYHVAFECSFWFNVTLSISCKNRGYYITFCLFQNLIDTLYLVVTFPMFFVAILASFVSLSMSALLYFPYYFFLELYFNLIIQNCKKLNFMKLNTPFQRDIKVFATAVSSGFIHLWSRELKEVIRTIWILKTTK